MTEPDKTAQEDEVDEGSEQILSTEANNMHVQVKMQIVSLLILTSM